MPERLSQGTWLVKIPPGIGPQDLVFGSLYQAFHFGYACLTQPLESCHSCDLTPRVCFLSPACVLDAWPGSSNGPIQARDMLHELHWSMHSHSLKVSWIGTAPKKGQRSIIPRAFNSLPCPLHTCLSRLFGVVILIWASGANEDGPRQASGLP